MTEGGGKKYYLWIFPPKFWDIFLMLRWLFWVVAATVGLRTQGIDNGLGLTPPRGWRSWSVTLPSCTPLLPPTAPFLLQQSFPPHRKRESNISMEYHNSSQQSQHKHMDYHRPSQGKAGSKLYLELY